MQRTLYLIKSWDFTKEGDFEWYLATFLSSLLFLIANVNGKFIGHRKKRNCERCALKSRHSFWLASVYRGEVHKKIPYSNAMITWTVEWIHGKSRERGIYPQRVCDLIKDEASIISIIHLIVCGLHGACKRTSWLWQKHTSEEYIYAELFYLNCITTTFETWPKCIPAGSFPDISSVNSVIESYTQGGLEPFSITELTPYWILPELLHISKSKH